MTDGQADQHEVLASEVYDIVESRMNPLKRWVLMGFFWFMALISMGSATPVPATKAWAITRKSDGVIVSTVGDEMAGESSVKELLAKDLATKTKAEFDTEWGIP